MFTDAHTSYLTIMLRASEARTNGWRGLLDHATPRCPEPVVAELRAQLAASEAETEGWRGLRDYADAHRTLPELSERAAADIASYSTGARLDAPPKPCTCGAPDTEGIVHRQGGFPCYTDEESPAGPKCTCGLPGTPGVWHGFDGQPCRVAPPDVPVAGQDPAPTLTMPELTPEQIVDQVAAQSRQDSALRRLGEADDSPDGPQHRAPRQGREPYPAKGGDRS